MNYRRISPITIFVLTALLLVSSVSAHGGHGGVSESPLFFVDYRNLNGGEDGVLLLNLDPESEQFGEIMQDFPLGEGITPHHLYYNRDESRLYNTSLNGEYLYELILERDDEGVPTIREARPIDVGENTVGEDMYFTEDGSRFYMTFMGGLGGERDGSVGVFDAETNELIKTITAPEAKDDPYSNPFILYPHGISVNEELGHLMVTSTNHPDFVTGFGNTVTMIDMETNEAVSTHLVAEGEEDISLPVEVLLLRDDFPPFALVTTVNGGDIWIAPYDEETGDYGEFTQAVDGAAEGLGVALEFYVGPGDDPESEEDQLLYVSFGVPGIVNVYSLDNLPALELVRTIQTGAGAHHMAFFKTESGREVMVSQNNLLNLPNLNAGTLTISDIQTGELVATLDLAKDLGLMPESIESAVGNAHFLHH